MQAQFKDGSVIIVGRCADPKFREVGQDKKLLCTCGVAVGKRKVAGEEEPVTVWADVEAWGRPAKCLATAKKGDTILVVGRMRDNTYTGKDGQEHTSKRLVAEFICRMETMLEAAAPPKEETPAQAFTDVTDDEDAVPF